MRGRTVEIAISGCGAVTELYYAPVLRRLAREGLATVVACFDPNPKRLRAVRRSFPHAIACGEFEMLFDHGPRLMIVASPPRQHAAQAIATLSRGHHVLCEKPLALSTSEVGSMATAAATAGRRLLVGMVRRRLPAARLMRDVIAQEALGDPVVFDVFEGGPFEWPVQAPAYFDPSAGGVGVLADIGSHLLDLLGWWLGAPHYVTSADDAMGGVDANALLSLRCGGVPGRLRLSRDWHRPNHATVKGTRGVARWHLEQTDRIQLAVDGVDPSELLAPAGSPRTFLACFEAQLREVLAAVRGEPAEVVEASEVLPSVAVLEAARHGGSLLSIPWFSTRELAVARSLRSL